VRLIPRAAPFPIDDHPTYSRVVAMAFSQRRKTLGNALRNLLTRDEIGRLDIDPQARAERISPAQFALLANHVAARED
ncbi:MAG: rRNA adenine N-6-methyltransferase family protein, partial [Nevskiales bacterium]